MNWSCRIASLVCMVFTFSLFAGDLKLPRYFSDNMVLQREKPVLVKGWSKPGSEVNVTFSGQKKSAKADDSGVWQVTLEAMPGNATPGELSVKSGGETVVLKDVVIGDVILFARQTSVDIALGRDEEGKKAAESYNANPKYRALTIQTIPTPKPKSDLDEKATNGWQQVDKTNALKMSGAAFYLGKDLAEESDVPVGIIDVNLGRYFPMAWLSKETLLVPVAGSGGVVGRVGKMEAMYEAFTTGKPYGKGKKAKLIKENPLDLPLYPASGYNAIINPIQGIALKGIILQLGNDYPYIFYQKIKEEGKNLKFETRERDEHRTSNIEHPTSNILNLPDVIFVTDMLNLAEFKGLAPAKFAGIPTVAYFHENQLTYPTHYAKKKDRYFGWINITTALAADAVWFNSEYHMNSFLDEVTARIKKAPDCRPANLANTIREKSIIIPQGIDSIGHGAESMGKGKTKARGPRSETGDSFAARRNDNTAFLRRRCNATVGQGDNPGDARSHGHVTLPAQPPPLRILWAARWEFDKNPGDFFDALRILKGQGFDFRLSVIGGNPEDENPIFVEAEKEFEDYIDHWGFLESKDEYEQVLIESDVVISTAIHEFFGISMAEAVSAGAFPLVPPRLAYPEVLKENEDDSGKESFFYDGTSANLAEKIAKLARLKESDSIWEGDEHRGIRKVSRFYWENVIPEIDKQLIKLTTEKQ